MNKIGNRREISPMLIVFFLLTAGCCTAQDTIRNSYGLWVINDAKTLQKTIISDPGRKMCDLRKSIKWVQFDLRYTNSNNFMKQVLYPPVKTAWLRKPVAEALASVQAELISKEGYSLKIFDAYRPYSVTVRMWEPVQDDRYAADPRKGSGHNRGIAVDLTIIDHRTGKELDMGTDFDHFSDTAHHTFTALPPEVLRNRRLLKNTMEKHGFKALDTEWWHYSFPAAKEYELLDVPFDALRKL